MFSTVAYRKPEVFVQFVGTELGEVAPQQIISVRTRKTLTEPAGTFEIVLKTGTEASTDLKFAAGPLGSSDPSAEYWLDRIRPMTLCVIAFGSQKELDTVRASLAASSNTDKPSPEVLRSVVMLGIVDDVALFTSMGANGPQRSVRIMGRDMARVLLDDVFRRVVNTGADDVNLIPVGKKVSPEDREMLLKRSAISADQEALLGISLSKGAQMDIPLKEFFQGVLDRAPSLTLELQNKRKVKDYFNTVDMDPRLERLSATWHVLTRMLWYNGTPWQAMADLAPSPSTEMFVDTVGLSARLIVRRPPFGRPKAMAGFNAMAYMIAESSKVNYPRLMEDLLQPDVAGVPDKDEFVQTPSRVVPQENYHEVTGAELLQSAVSRNALVTFSMYHSKDLISQLGETPEIPTLITPMIYDLAAAVRYGTQVLPITVPWCLNTALYTMMQRKPDAPPAEPSLADKASLWPPKPAGAVQTSQKNQSGLLYENTRALNLIETIRAYYYFRDNPEYLSGMLRLRGRPEIRVGDRVKVPSLGDRVFYVESVEQAFSFGTPFTTTLSVSRGQPFTLEKRLAPETHDVDPPFGAPTNAVLATQPGSR